MHDNCSNLLNYILTFFSQKKNRFNGSKDIIFFECEVYVYCNVGNIC